MTQTEKDHDATTGAVTPRRFIPYRRVDLANMLLARDVLTPQQRAHFMRTNKTVQAHFQNEFYQLRQTLKNAYAPHDPDADTRFIGSTEDDPYAVDFSNALVTVLERANYDKVSDKDLQRAMRASSLFQVKLDVDLRDFEEVQLYTRGASRRTEVLREFFGLWKRRVQFTNFERVVLFLRFKPNLDEDAVLIQCPPGSTMIKLFQNVPEADIEMLFPNIRIGMRLIDKLLIGIPAIASGAAVFTTRMGATLLLLGSALGFWIGLSAEPVELNKAALIAALASIGALIGYGWKQFSNFRNRKLKYSQALTENLYFRLLDNNAGVFFRVLDDAEESECKEAMVALYFLLASNEPMTAAELDAKIEQWFKDSWNCILDFEVDDALRKLHTLELARCEGGRWTAVLA
jgi:hypothetical protein